MPGLDGWDFLDSFTELPEELKKSCSLYILSSSIDREDQIRTERHKDASGFITKPLSEKELEAVREQSMNEKK